MLLHSAGMSAGPPQPLSQLWGDDPQRMGEPERTLYRLGGVGYEEGKWLDCNYGAAGEVSISRPLDDRLQECIIAEIKAERPGAQRRVDIWCK